jgi:hypothetical protein
LFMWRALSNERTGLWLMFAASSEIYECMLGDTLVATGLFC